MRLGLIGASGHWQTYAAALGKVPGLTLAAVAPAGPEETLGAFDHAPGAGLRMRRYDDARKLLDSEPLDLVQLCGRCDLNPGWIRQCLERGLPVIAEKPLAMDLPTLEGLFRAARKAKRLVVPLHTMRGVPELAAVRRAVQSGEIGEPLLSSSQKSYKWGKRPDTFRDLGTFPGIVPWVGIHALDWLHWILGDVFTEVRGRQGTAAHPDFPACASQAGLILTMKNGGVAILTLDYLRPDTAPTHGDERLRIAGTRGVIETALTDHRVSLTTVDKKPISLPLPPQFDLFTRFALSLQGDGPPPLTLEEGFRITEIALKAQQAMQSPEAVSLRDSPF